MNEGNSDYLAEIYRGARMGAETIDTIIPRVKGKRIRNELVREQEIYRAFQNKALNEIRSRNENPAPIKPMQRRMARMGVKMNTSMNRTSSHIADIIIQGNNMGIIGMTKTMNHHKNADEHINSLANELVDIQKDNIENLRPYL